MINIPKGTKDVLPSESYKWQYVEKAARDLCSLYNIKEIRTPVFEHTELFLRNIGETSDIVNKEMYTFLDKGGRSITLKPEGTAGVVRSFIENGLNNSQMPLKMFYFTPVFRYERPQGGRLREHHQFGIEVFGADLPQLDAELIEFADLFFKGLGIKNLELFINSIGCGECRPKYNAVLKDYFKKNIDTMCAVCKDRLEKNPLRILDCKEEVCSKINENAPKTVDYLCDDCRNHFEKFQTILKDKKIGFKINPKIVRGLDYYTKTVFEFVSENLGAKSTVLGGGRYNGLVEKSGGKPTPAIGFGMGIERLLLILENLKIEIKRPELNLYIANLEGFENNTMELAGFFRKNGITCETDLTNRNLKSQFKYADNIKAKYVLVIGDDEVKTKVLTLKEMSTGTEQKLSKEQIIEIIKFSNTND
ncbi:MAG: histidine--tRNA ligase [Firmicutes bacterium]|nr:histidine--tRNA ligase [Bacillota bacterium]